MFRVIHFKCKKIRKATQLLDEVRSITTDLAGRSKQLRTCVNHPVKYRKILEPYQKKVQILQSEIDVFVERGT